MIEAESRSFSVVVEAACRGDVQAFERLFDEYSSSVLALALTWTGDRSIAEDVLQDSFLRVWTRLDRLRDPKKFKPWLWRIVVNCARDARRARKPDVGLQSEPLAQLSMDHADEVADRLELQAALDNLPRELRDAVSLFYLADLSERDTAAVLRWRLGTLKSRLNRARELLRRRLGGDVEEESR